MAKQREDGGGMAPEPRPGPDPTPAPDLGADAAAGLVEIELAIPADMAEDFAEMVMSAAARRSAVSEAESLDDPAEREKRLAAIPKNTAEVVGQGIRLYLVSRVGQFRMQRAERETSIRVNEVRATPRRGGGGGGG